MNIFKRLSSAKKNASGAPFVRIGDTYLTGVSELDEVSVISADNDITGHITLRHLDKLGNGNYAIPNHPHQGTRRYAFEQRPSNVLALRLQPDEAVVLWDVLDRVLAATTDYVTIPKDIKSEKLRWMRDRLAIQTQQHINSKTEKE